MSLLRYATLGGDKFRDEYSLSFDGTNDYVDCGNDSSIQMGTNDFSICAWIKKAVDNENAVIVAHGRDTDPRWFFRIDDSNKLEMFSDDGTGTSLISASTITGTGWNHVAFSWDRDSATGAKIYINGVLDAERDGTDEQGTLTNSSYGTLIGARRTTGSTIAQYWNGKISEIALYSSALSASQVKTIYNGREPYNHKEGVASGSLVSWWRMGDGALDDKNGLIGDETNVTKSSQIIADGNFDTAVGESTTGTYWITQAGWTIGSGSATYDGGGDSNTRLTSVVNSDIIDAEIHQVNFTLTDTGGGGVYLRLCDGSWSLVTGTGEKTIYILAGTGTNNITFETGHNDKAFTIDNLTIYKINGNAGLMTNMTSDDFTGDTP